MLFDFVAQAVAGITGTWTAYYYLSLLDAGLVLVLAGLVVWLKGKGVIAAFLLVTALFLLSALYGVILPAVNWVLGVL